MSVSAFTLQPIITNLVSFAALSGTPASFYDNAGDAVVYILAKENPQIAAFGEYHQTKSNLAHLSTLRVFNKDIFPKIGNGFQELVFEGFFKHKQCSAQMDKDSAELKALTQKTQCAFSPLPLDCQELYPKKPGDNINLIMLALAIKETAQELILKAAANKKRVLYYGGAFHNDTRPEKLLRDFSFSRFFIKKGFIYVEIDLVMPELALQTLTGKRLKQLEKWLRIQLKHNNKIMAVKTGKRSYWIILPQQST